MGFAEAASAAKPLRAGSTRKRSRQETRISRGAPMSIIGAVRAQNGLGMKSRLPFDNPGGWLDSGVDGRFSGTIRLKWWVGLFSPVWDSPEG